MHVPSGRVLSSVGRESMSEFAWKRPYNLVCFHCAHWECIHAIAGPSWAAGTMLKEAFYLCLHLLSHAIQACLWEELVFSGECRGRWLTHFSVWLFSGEAAPASCFPNHQRILSVGCCGETCWLSEPRLAKSKASLACRDTVQQGSLDKHRCCPVPPISPFLISDPRKKFLCSLLSQDR